MGKKILQKTAKLMVPLLVMVCLFAGGRAAAAADGEAMEQLRNSIDTILHILKSDELKAPGKEKERKQRILAVVEKMFDFREMARSSLGQSWNTLSPAEQDKFVGLFTDLVQQRYIGKIDSYDDQEVAYRKELVRGDRAMIYTDIIDKDLKTPIVYRMEKKSGKWLVYDLKIENVSLLANYRRDFDSVIRREQFAGLVEKITKQLEKSETSN